MAKRTMATSGHSGGSGFDPLSYSPLSDPKPEPEPEPKETEEGGWGELVLLGILAIGGWVISKVMGDPEKSD